MQENQGVRKAPETFLGIIKELGPGLIVAGSIVGSGELIATTLTGAEAGFWLMWLIIIGCVIKVFAQLEIGRYTITTGKTALEGLSRLPGIRPKGVHWAVWIWLIMFIASVGQYGGIVGSIGQSVGIAVPLTEEGRAFNEAADVKVKAQIRAVTGEVVSEGVAGPIENGEEAAATDTAVLSAGKDAYYWAFVLTLFTSAILFWGRYGMIEKTVMVMVGGFTLLSIGNLYLLQQNATWAVSSTDILNGLSFRLPPAREGLQPIATALATFGIIGMAAGELIYYPYWCLEKGYARFIGKPEDTTAWRERAKGWNRVMRWDAWLSMVVYTFSTLVFYLMGAAVLGRADLRPEGLDLIRTLAAMYEPAFSEWGVAMFLFGSIAVLFSTFFVGTASLVLVFADALGIFTKGRKKAIDRERVRPWLSLGLPIVAFVMFVFFPKPKFLILIAGMMNTFMLPILGFAALYYRYRFTSEEFRPRLIWDVFLWLSSFALLVVGLWLAAKLLGVV